MECQHAHLSARLKNWGRRCGCESQRSEVLMGRAPDPVPLEYSIGCLTCTVASMMDAVMVGLPGAAQDRLPAHVPGTRPDRPGIPRRPGERCRPARAPAPERGAAPARRPGTVRAGRQGMARRGGAAYTAQALDRDLPRDVRDAPGLAPQTGRRQVRHERAAQAWPPAGGPGHRPPGRSPGKRRIRVGYRRIHGRWCLSAGLPAVCRSRRPRAWARAASRRLRLRVRGQVPAHAGRRRLWFPAPGKRATPRAAGWRALLSRSL